MNRLTKVIIGVYSMVKNCFLLFFIFVFLIACQKTKKENNNLKSVEQSESELIDNKITLENDDIVIPENIEVEIDPGIMFDQLFSIYEGGEKEYIDTNAQNDDGALLVLYDRNNILSKDTFCNIIILSPYGKTEYYCYNEFENDIWYLYKKAYFYQESYVTEDAKIKETYFKYNYVNTYTYNFDDQKYNILLEINKATAVIDFRGIDELMKFIKENIKRW
jgi:hypothetical protein